MTMTMLVNSTKSLKVTFYADTAKTQPITPPAQYVFTSNNSHLVVGTPTAFDTVPLTADGSSVIASITITPTGLNNGAIVESIQTQFPASASDSITPPAGSMQTALASGVTLS